MQSIIESIYQRMLEMNDEKKNDVGQMQNEREYLCKQLLRELSEKQKQTFENYILYEARVHSEKQYEMFCKGFQTGVKMMVESLGGEVPEDIQ